MVLGAVVTGEREDALEGADVVRNEDTVICLSDGSNIKVVEGDVKTRFLGGVELFIVINLIEISRGDSALFDTLLIKDRSMKSVFSKGSAYSQVQYL